MYGSFYMFRQCARLFNWSAIIRHQSQILWIRGFLFVSSYANCEFSSEYRRFIMCVYTEITCLSLQDIHTWCGRWCSGSQDHVFVFILSLLQCVFVWHFGYIPAFYVWCHYVVFPLSAGGDNAVRLWCQQRMLFPWSPPQVAHNFRRRFCQSHFSARNSCYSRVFYLLRVWFWARYLRTATDAFTYVLGLTSICFLPLAPPQFQRSYDPKLVYRLLIPCDDNFFRWIGSTDSVDQWRSTFNVASDHTSWSRSICVLLCHKLKWFASVCNLTELSPMTAFSFFFA
jgi:hypothetical protein